MNYNNATDVYDVRGVFPLAVFARHIACDEIRMFVQIRNIRTNGLIAEEEMPCFVSEFWRDNHY